MRLSGPDAHLKINEESCTKCGLCAHICWTHAMITGENGYPEMKSKDPDDKWHSCWACQRCMAVCPTGALSICDKNPNDSIPASAMPSAKDVENLMLLRRTCRDFSDEKIPHSEIERILKIVACGPTAGCQQKLQFSVIEGKGSMERFKKHLWQRACENAEQGIFPSGFGEKDFYLAKKGIDKGNDTLFRNASNLLLIHEPGGMEASPVDTSIAMTYAELLLNANGYGTVIASFAWAILKSLPDVRAELGIPEDHFLQCPILFGVPSVRFARSVQRFDALKINKIDW